MNWNDEGLEYLQYTKELQLQHVYQESLENVKYKLNNLYSKHDKLTYADVLQYNRMQKIEHDLISEINALGGKAKRITRATLKEGFEHSYYFTGFAVENHTGINMGFTKLPVDTIEAALEDPYDWPIRTTTNGKLLKQRLKDTVVRSLIQGYSYGKMVTHLTQSMNIGLKSARKLLRTEVHRAQVKGRLVAIEKTEEATKLLKVKTIRTWRSTKDDRTRDSHKSMQGKPANKKGLFTLPSGAKARGPGLSGIAEEDINCRCTIMLVFPDYEPEVDEAIGMEPKKGFSCLLKNR